MAGCYIWRCQATDYLMRQNIWNWTYWSTDCYIEKRCKSIPLHFGGWGKHTQVSYNCGWRWRGYDCITMLDSDRWIYIPYIYKFLIKRRDTFLRLRVGLFGILIRCNYGANGLFNQRSETKLASHLQGTSHPAGTCIFTDSFSIYAWCNTNAALPTGPWPGVNGGGNWKYCTCDTGTYELICLRFIISLYMC